MTPAERFTEFAKDASKRDKLAAALATPELVEAFDIVKELMEPETKTQADAAPAMAASYYHQVAGANYFRKKLRELTRVPQEPKVLRTKQFAKTVDDLPK